MIKAIKRHLFEWDGEGPDWSMWFIASLPYMAEWILRLCGVMP
jgi:hypothetical protein